MQCWGWMKRGGWEEREKGGLRRALQERGNQARSQLAGEYLVNQSWRLLGRNVYLNSSCGFGGKIVFQTWGGWGGGNCCALGYISGLTDQIKLQWIKMLKSANLTPQRIQIPPKTSRKPGNTRLVFPPPYSFCSKGKLLAWCCPAPGLERTFLSPSPTQELVHV